MQIIKSYRKSMTLTIKNWEVIVKVPYLISKKTINKFIEKHQEWINKKLKSDKDKIILTDKEIKILKYQAKNYIPERVKFFVHKFNLSFNTIKITSAKTRWWSCTSKRNLNFSYRLIQTPDSVIDYVIIHELAHLTYMNHSKQFWNEVEKMMPSYKKEEKWLKENGDFIL